MDKQKNLENATQKERAKLKTFAANASDLQELIAQIEKEINIREEAARLAELRDRPNITQPPPETLLFLCHKGI